MYILCLYQKILLRGDFRFLQKISKGAIWKMQIYYWVYAYILPMMKGYLRVENTAHSPATKTAHRWIAIAVGAVRYHYAIVSLSFRYHISLTKVK